MVHRISFSSIAQSNNETVQNYIVWLQSGSEIVNLYAQNCHHDLFHIYIEDQFIWGTANDALQADMQSKAGSLKILEQTIRPAEHLKWPCETKMKYLVFLTWQGCRCQHIVNKGGPGAWGSNHKAGSVYLELNTSNIFQQCSLYWCQNFTFMLPHNHNITNAMPYILVLNFTRQTNQNVTILKLLRTRRLVKIYKI